MNSDLIDRIRSARDMFIFYYNRGENQKHWHRSFSLYFMWAFSPIENGPMDYEIFTIWCSVSSFYSCEESFDRVMHQFVIMEKYVKNWVFS